jgi:chaperonin GroES
MHRAAAGWPARAGALKTGLRGRERTSPASPDPTVSTGTTVAPGRHRRNCALATATASKLRPLGDRIVILPTPREETTKSGIVLPDTAKEKPQEGSVLAVGPGALDSEGKRQPVDVKVGDKVLYAKYAGTEFKIDDEELLIVSQKDILAVVEA